MTVSEITRGQDTHVNSGSPAANFADARYPKVKSGTHRILLSMPLAGIADKTIISATLSGRVRSTWASQTITVQALSASWKADRVTWDDQPGVTGSTATVATGALTDGQRWTCDVTTLVQAVADGQAHYGWRITTGYAASEQTVYGFESGAEAWVLEVEVSDVPDAPSQLVPTGVISLNKWVCSVDNIDDLAAIRVQIDAAADAGSPDFDSGAVSTTIPSLDLAATAYGGLADGATTYWRAQVKTTDDAWSDWSDWVAVTRHVKPTLSLLQPSGSTIKDSSPTIEPSIPAGVVQRFRVRFTKSGDRTKVKYDSGVLDGDGTASPAWTIPDGYLKEDAQYDLNVRVWDRTDRVASVGDDTFTELWQSLTLDTDSSQTPPDSLIAVDLSPEGPGGVELTWSRAINPTWFVIFRNGVRVGRVAGTERTFIDYSCPPNTTVTYTVRAVTSGNQSPDSNAVEVYDECHGVWLVSEVHGSVMLRGGDIAGIVRRDKRASFDLPGRRDRVDIVSAFGGYEGTPTLELNDLRGNDVDAAVAVLDAMKYDPATPVRLVWVTVNIPVYVRDVTVTPHPEYLPDQVRRYIVKFEFWQAGEFDEDGMP